MKELYGDWLRQREGGKGDVILVRPDKYIVWRDHNMVEGPSAGLVLFN